LATFYFNAKINPMNKRKLIFWLFIGLLLLADAGVLIYYAKAKQPKADVPLSTPPFIGSKSDLLLSPTSIVPDTLPEIKIGEERKIYDLSSNYTYKCPVLIKRETDYLLFLARGKNPTRLDEIIYTRSTDLTNWTEEKSAWSSKDQKIKDLEGKKTNSGYFLLFLVEQEGVKSLKYLYSEDGSKWEEKSFPGENQNCVRLSLSEEKNSLRLLQLWEDQKTIKQSFSVNGENWLEPKEIIKLNLKIDDLAVFKKDNFWLLFTINNEIYNTPSLDFHSFRTPSPLISIADSVFSISDAELVYSSKSAVFLRTLE